jgi:hypothetical protein
MVRGCVIVEGCLRFCRRNFLLLSRAAPGYHACLRGLTGLHFVSSLRYQSPETRSVRGDTMRFAAHVAAVTPALIGLAFVTVPRAHASGLYGHAGLAGGYRWDAAPRNIGGFERSLSGGLRFSLQGGSYQAYRDLFTWDVVPTVPVFQQTVLEAFNAWTVVDPASGLATNLSFVPDLGTAVVGTGAGGVNTAGAEIDLLGTTDANSWNPGDAGARGETFFNAQFGNITLTSGTANYPGGGAISGADVTLNRNPQAVYTLDVFRLLLSHELGHALGMSDADVQAGPSGNFIDDNYNGSTNATALATLTNSWAALVNASNPAASAGLSLYFVANGAPGIDTAGVNILMESQGLGGKFGNLTPLSNDDFGGRQFLYPYVPEPAMLGLLAIPAVLLCRRR